MGKLGSGGFGLRRVQVRVRITVRSSGVVGESRGHWTALEEALGLWVRLRDLAYIGHRGWGQDKRVRGLKG